MDYKRAITGVLLSFAFLLLAGLFAWDTNWAMQKFQPAGLIQVQQQSVILQSDPATAGGTEEKQPVLEIGAGAAIAIESDLSGKSKVLFSKEAEKQLPMASLTKLVTAMVVLDNYDSQEITLPSLNACGQPSMQKDLEPGRKMSIGSLLYIMLIESSNKSACALSEVMGREKFVELMNQKAREIGASDTFFEDATGLSDNNKSTARDLAVTVEYILKSYPQIAQISRLRSFDVPGFGIVENTNQLLGEIPEVAVGKTGFTTDAKGCLVLALNNAEKNNYLIFVILGSDDRFLEMKKLINFVQQIK